MTIILAITIIIWADQTLLPLNNAFRYNNIFAITIFLRVTKDIVIAKLDCTTVPA